MEGERLSKKIANNAAQLLSLKLTTTSFTLSLLIQCALHFVSIYYDLYNQK